MTNRSGIYGRAGRYERSALRFSDVENVDENQTASSEFLRHGAETMFKRIRKPVRNDLTREQVAAVLAYNPENGYLYRRANGRRLGTPNSGKYLQVVLFGRRYYSHRIIWLLAYGEWPKHEIDHIDRNRSNNRIANLRDVTHRDNQHHQLNPIWRRSHAA